MPETTNLQMLPNEVLEQITKWLDIESLVKLSSTDKRFNNFINSSQYTWRHHCSICNISGRPSGDSTWKDYFMERYPAAMYKQRWLDGEFSYISSAEDSRLSSKGYELDVNSWGDILERELSRS